MITMAEYEEYLLNYGHEECEWSGPMAGYYLYLTTGIGIEEDRCQDPAEEDEEFEFACKKYNYYPARYTCDTSYMYQFQADQCLDERFFKLFYRPMCDDELEMFGGENGWIYYSTEREYTDDYFFVSEAEYQNYLQLMVENMTSLGEELNDLCEESGPMTDFYLSIIPQ